jgi:8-oxo-dGTP pyrophosphatase MutT (NUDIX family)
MKKCGVIVIDSETKNVLLVLGKKSHKWGFPKGHMEQGEDEEQTALRELYEETGIRWNHNLTNRIRFKNNIYFVIYVQRDMITKQIQIHDHREIEQVAWLSMRDIFQLPDYQCNFGLKSWIKLKDHDISNLAVGN